MVTRQIILELDEDDWDAIQGELARFQAHRVDDGNGGTQPIVPEGESNLPGAILAEVVREVVELRSLYDAEHPA